jgi:uncharacterized protein (DUF2336 family)
MVAITRELVVRFAEEPSWTARAKIAERVATRYAENALATNERLSALDLLRLAIYDGEPLVRRVVAETVKFARDLPRDIVRALAADVPEVSVPFIAVSPLLGEEDLLSIAKIGAAAQRAAIACRPRLSSRVANLVLGRQRPVIA